MSTSQDLEEQSSPTVNRFKRPRLDYTKEYPLLGRLRYIRSSVDQERYTYAMEELKSYFDRKGYDEISGLFHNMANYNIIVVPYTYEWGSEDIVARIVRNVKGWSSIEVRKLTQILIDNADLLSKLGHPISQIAYLIENEKVKTKIRTVSSHSGSVKGGVVYPPIGVRGTLKRDSKKEVSQELEGNSDTIRTVISMLLDNISRPTLLILNDNELEFLKADTILNAVVANKNLSVLVYLPDKPSIEFRKLLESERVVSTNPLIFYSSTKSFIINVYNNLRREYANTSLIRKIRDGRRLGTKVGLSNTITLLMSMGLLQRAVGKFIYRLVNPLLIIQATNMYIAKMYSLITRPSKIMEFYRRSDPDTKRVVRQVFMELSDRISGEVMGEITVNVYTPSSIVSIYNMLKTYNVKPSDLRKILKSPQEISYPIYMVNKELYPLLEYMRKVGILSVIANRNGEFTVRPGVQVVYRNISNLLENEDSMSTAVRLNVT